MSKFDEKMDKLADEYVRRLFDVCSSPYARIDFLAGAKAARELFETEPRPVMNLLSQYRDENTALREALKIAEEALKEISETCPIIQEMSDTQLIKCDGDDFLFKSSNRRRKIAREALAKIGEIK